jgi:hypothetical protein
MVHGCLFEGSREIARQTELKGKVELALEVLIFLELLQSAATLEYSLL